MEILYCTDLVLDNHSAPAVHVDTICTQFEELGHTVTLYAPRQGTFIPTGQYRVVRIPTPRLLLSLFYQPQLALRLAVKILRKQPDIVYVRHSHLLIVPTLIGKLFHVPVMLEINGILAQDARHINQTLRSRFLLASGIFSLLECMNARLATRCIVVTRGIKDYFVARYRVSAEKIMVIQNGVDTDFFKPMSQKEVRRSLGFENDTINIGYVGSLHAWQGVRYITVISAAIREVHPEVRFVIIGDGEEKEFLETYIREHDLKNVELRPAIPHGQVPLYINTFDICISYPVKFRDGATSPFKVYEYLACGKPVISSDLKSMHEEFGDALTYAPAESADALAAAIEALIKDPERTKKGERGRAFVEQGHSWKSVAHTISALFEAIV